MAEPITAAVSDRICKHMNDDHRDAVLMYAQVYGDRREATAATMKSIDPEGMDLMAEVQGSTVPVRVSFETPIETAEDAHHLLIDMLKQARQGSQT